MRKTLPFALVGLAFVAVSCGEKSTGEKVDDATKAAETKVEDATKAPETK